jgi:hypothetical protein
MTADIKDLNGATFEELEAWFEEGVEPSLDELDGGYNGRVLALAGTDMIPAGLRGALATVYGSFLMPWRGKRFMAGDGETRIGSNTWLTPRGPDIVSFTCTAGDGSILLDYDVKSNPPPLRRIIGAVRRLAPGLYLGRMCLRAGDRLIPVLYFSLESP